MIGFVIENGRRRYLAQPPVEALGEDGATVDRDEMYLVDDVTAAFDFTKFVVNQDRARDLLKLVAPYGVTFEPPIVVEVLPLPPRLQPLVVKPVVECRHNDRPEGVALRERKARERADEATRAAAEEVEKERAAQKAQAAHEAYAEEAARVREEQKARQEARAAASAAKRNA